MSACKNNNNSPASHLQLKRSPMEADDPKRLDTDASILITHYVNPQLFCFTTLQQLEAGGVMVNHAEAQLAPYCEAANRRDLYVPDTLVIVRYQPLRLAKLLRGRVIASQNSEYIVWTLDYGFALTCRARDLWLLPAHLSQNYVKFGWGGVAGIAPHGASQWSKMARRLLEKRLEEAQRLLFRIEYGSRTHHSFGQLLIKTQKEPPLDAAKYLLEKQLAQLELDKSNPVLANSFWAAYDVDLAEVNDGDIQPSARISAIMELMQMQQPKMNQVQPQAGKVKHSNAIFKNGYHQLGARTRQLTAPGAQPDKLDTLLRNWTAPAVPVSAKRLSKVASSSAGCVETALQSGSGSSSTKDSTDSFDARAQQSGTIIGRRNILNCYRQGKSLEKSKEASMERQLASGFLAQKVNSNIQEEPKETRNKDKSQKETYKLELDEQPSSGKGNHTQFLARNHMNNMREEPEETRNKDKSLQEQKEAIFLARNHMNNKREEPEETQKLELVEKPLSDAGKFLQQEVSKETFQLKLNEKPDKSLHQLNKISRIHGETKEAFHLELNKKPQIDAGKFLQQEESKDVSLNRLSNIHGETKEAFQWKLNEKKIIDAGKSGKQQHIKEITKATWKLEPDEEEQQLLSSYPIKNIKEQSKKEPKLEMNGKGKSMQQLCINYIKKETGKPPKLDKLERICNEYSLAKCPTDKLKPLQNRVLAHSNLSVLPMDSWPESLLGVEVLRAMAEMNVKMALATQRYSWPHLMRGNSLLLIDRTRSGRSWCYLPALCSLVMHGMRSMQPSSQLGPLALLLADSASTAETLAHLCSQLLSGFETKLMKVVGSQGHGVDTQVQMLLNSCGILVTTPGELEKLFHSQRMSLIDPRRLKYLILDDYDRMRCTAPKLLNELLQHLQRLLSPVSSSSSSPIQVQLILIAQQWHSRSFPQLAKRFGRNPLVLFGDFLEAAVYGSIKLNVTVIRSSRKTKQLLDYLDAQKSQQRRTIIYCKHEQELESLRQDLTAAGHECIAGNEAANQQLHQLLLLTDAVQLSVRNFELLVHYSLPDSWSRFSHRFHAVSAKIGNFLSPPANLRRDLVSYVMLDESNMDELPRLVQFLDAHHIEVAPHLQQLVTSCRQVTDQTRSICPQLLSSGECVQLYCSKRHHPLPRDVQGSGPGSGTGSASQLFQPGCVVRCQLVKVYDPVHLAVMPVSYKDSNGGSWRSASNLSTLRQLSTALDMHMSSDANRRQQQSLEMGDVCVLRRSLKHQRVRIVDISEKRLVTVQLMDEGTALLKVKPLELLECPARFALEPPLAMDVRLCGFLPCPAEGSGLAEATSWVKELLNGIKEQQHLQLIIQFAMLDVVYVRDITVLQECPTLRTCVQATRLHEELLSRGYAKRDAKILENLRRLHEKLNVGKEQSEGEVQTETVPEQSATSSKQSQPEMKVNHLKIETETEIEPIVKKSAATFLNVLLQNLSSDDAHLKDAARHLMQDVLDAGDEPKIQKPTLKKKQPQVKAQLTPAKMTSALCCAAVARNAVRPRVRWHQTRLHIELIFEQQVPQYELLHRANVLFYEVTETEPPQRCILNLLGEVRVVSEQQHGYQLHVKLAKDGLHVFWPSLLASLPLQRDSHWLVYDSERGQSPQTDRGRLHWTRYLRNQHQREELDEDWRNWSADEPSEQSDVERAQIESGEDI